MIRVERWSALDDGRKFPIAKASISAIFVKIQATFLAVVNKVDVVSGE